MTGNLDSMSCELQGAVDYMRERARAGRSLFKEHGVRTGGKAKSCVMKLSQLIMMVVKPLYININS